MTNSGGNEIEPGGAGDMAVIGEGTPHQTSVSLQVLQDIYHELTGKTEDVSKSYSDSFQIVHADFEQLHHRVSQCCEQYSITASSCHIKVYYTNDTQETYSTFEQFRNFNAGSSSSIESVFIKYNFLILLPRLNQPQSYTLSVRTASRISIERKMRDEMPFHVPKILRVMGGRTGVVTVEYVDYVVARTLLNVVDEWFKTLPKARTNRYWEAVRKRSDYLRLIARYTVGAIVALLIFLALPTFIPPNATLLQFAQVFLCASVGLFGSYRLANHFGRSAEDSVDNWSELSYVSLTAGDKKAIEDAREKNKHSLLAAALKFISALLVSVVAKLIISLIVGS